LFLDRSRRRGHALVHRDDLQRVNEWAEAILRKISQQPVPCPIPTWKVLLERADYGPRQSIFSSIGNTLRPFKNRSQPRREISGIVASRIAMSRTPIRERCGLEGFEATARLDLTISRGGIKLLG
jgi:hypothetical protein